MQTSYEIFLKDKIASDYLMDDSLISASFLLLIHPQTYKLLKKSLHTSINLLVNVNERNFAKIREAINGAQKEVITIANDGTTL